MTWGQLRFTLQTSLPGVTLDLLDEWLNCRYEAVLSSCDWTGIDYHTTLMTTAAYQSGSDTVTLTLGNAGVVGVGTTWTAAATLGMQFYRPGDSVIYTVTAWNSATSITLDRPYEGNGADAVGTVYSASAYVFMQNVYPLPADVSIVVTCLDPVTGFPLTPFTKDAADVSWGPRTLVQDPESYCITDDSNESAPPVVHQIELFPPPLYARGIKIKYQHSAIGFDGSSTGASPLPWVSNSVLLYGVRADANAHLAGKTDAAGEKAAYLGLAKMYELKFDSELARLLRQEHVQRRQKRPLQMATRFIRHRLTRAGRGFNNDWGPGAGGLY